VRTAPRAGCLWGLRSADVHVGCCSLLKPALILHKQVPDERVETEALSRPKSEGCFGGIRGIAVRVRRPCVKRGRLWIEVGRSVVREGSGRAEK